MTCKKLVQSFLTMYLVIFHTYDYFLGTAGLLQGTGTIQDCHTLF